MSIFFQKLHFDDVTIMSAPHSEIMCDLIYNL